MARPGLGSNRKFLRLARTIGSKVLARGILETLWEPCYEAGDPYVGTSADIEALCEWTGARGMLTAALADAGAPKAGFIELVDVRGATEPHYQIHDLLQNAPVYVAQRRNRHQERTLPKICEHCRGTFFAAEATARFCSPACRTAGWRGRQRAPVTPRVLAVSSVPTPVTATVTANVTPRDTTPVPVPDPVPVHVQAVRTLVDDPAACDAAENRHEGNERENPLVARPHQRLQKRRAPDPQPDASPIVLTFPVTGVRGPTWDLRDAVITRWQELYPSLDVLSEARQALAYVEAASARRKTFDGMTKFLVAWLNRSTDSSRGRGPTLITGSLKTAGNRAALDDFVRRNARVD